MILSKSKVIFKFLILNTNFLQISLKIKLPKLGTKLIIKAPNTANPGSLLKLCDIKLMHTYGFNSAKVSLFSTNNIKLLQLLWPFPPKLSLNGTVFMSEIVPYIFENTGVFKMITGWIEHTGADEDNNSSSLVSYNYLWKLLSPERKCGVFEIYKGFKLYIIPMDVHNRSFFKTLGLKIFYVDEDSLEERIYPVESSAIHYFAFIGFIKNIEQHNGYLNPEVIFDTINSHEAIPAFTMHQQPDNNLDVDFVLDLIIDFESGVVPIEDLMIRLQSEISQERINRSLDKLDKDIREKFELLLTKIVEFKQISKYE